MDEKSGVKGSGGRGNKYRKGKKKSGERCATLLYRGRDACKGSDMRDRAVSKRV